MELTQKVYKIMDQVYEGLKGKEYILCTEEYYNSDDNEDIFDLPIVTRYGEHGHYTQYCIMEVSDKGYLKLGGLGEDHGTISAGLVSDLDFENACYLLEEINNN